MSWVAIADPGARNGIIDGEAFACDAVYLVACDAVFLVACDVHSLPQNPEPPKTTPKPYKVKPSALSGLRDDEKH